MDKNSNGDIINYFNKNMLYKDDEEFKDKLEGEIEKQTKVWNNIIHTIVDVNDTEYNKILVKAKTEIDRLKDIDVTTFSEIQKVVKLYRNISEIVRKHNECIFYITELGSFISVNKETLLVVAQHKYFGRIVGPIGRDVRKKINMRIFEIIDRNQPRKFALIISNNIDIITKYLKEFMFDMYKIDAEIENIDNSVNFRIKNTRYNSVDHRDIFEKFRFYMFQKNKELLDQIDFINSIDVEIENTGERVVTGRVEYVAICNMIKECTSNDMIFNYLTQHHDSINSITINITNNIDNSINNGSIIINVNDSSSEKDKVKLFILLNPPTENMSAENYYRQYSKTTSKPVKQKSFYDAMRDGGYNNEKRMHGSRARYWSKTN